MLLQKDARSCRRTLFDSAQHCIGTQLTLGVAIVTRRLEILLPERERERERDEFSGILQT